MDTDKNMPEEHLQNIENEIIPALKEKVEQLPSIVCEKISLVRNLEKNLYEAQQKAKQAKEKSEQMKGYKEKTFFGFTRKTGDTKEIVEGTQDVVKIIAEAQTKATEAQRLLFEYETKLAEACEYLFYLGCYNIAQNEAMIESLNTELQKESDTKLSEEAKKKFREVVGRLKAQQDVLYRQEQLKKKSKRHGKAIARNVQQLNELEQALKEKDILDDEQSALIENIKLELLKKDTLDEEQSNRIKELQEVHENVLKQLKAQENRLSTIQQSSNASMVEQQAQFNKLKKQVAVYKYISFAAIVVSLISIIYMLLG